MNRTSSHYLADGFHANTRRQSWDEAAAAERAAARGPSLSGHQAVTLSGAGDMAALAADYWRQHGQEGPAAFSVVV